MKQDNLVETVLFWFIALTPIWWVCGILVPMVLVGVPVLFLLKPPTSRTMRWVVGLWVLAGLLQALSAGINWSLADEPLDELPRRLLTMYSLGWVMLGMCFGLGSRIAPDSPRLVRAMMLQGASVLGLAVIAYGIRSTTSLREFDIQTPLAVLKGSFPSAQHHFVAHFFHMEDFGGQDRVRLTLFFPWVAGLGVWGMVIMFAAIQEKAWFWRLVGFAGGLTGLLSSFSRATMVAALLALGLLIALKSPAWLRIAIAGLGAVVLNFAVLLGWDPVTAFDRLHTAFHAARQGSSEVRLIIYDWSWALWQESPWIGYGRMGDVFSRWYSAAPIGSHSTFYGTLYTGGVMTFAAVMAAYLAALAVAIRGLRRGDYASQSAFCMLVALGLVAYGESFYSLVPSLTAPLVWLGWRIGSIRPQPRPVLKACSRIPA